MKLISYYEAAIATGDINDDAQQRRVLHSLQRLKDDLEKPQKPLFPWLRKQSVKGIYLYGPVGVGKTYLMDLFYAQCVEPQKARFHFHHFMQQIDAQLRLRQGQKDPLKRIAADLAKRFRLLCFDEFLVHDVAIAMILAELLQALFANGVTLMVTGNTAPDALYLNGVQRPRFLPAIALIKTRCEVIGLNYQQDYRLGREVDLKTYVYPLNRETDTLLQEQFAGLAENAKQEGVLCIQNREIPFIQCGAQEVWFDFRVICNLPRSQLDYLEIADRFDTVFVSGVPVLTERDTVFAILLIHLIDVLYDRGIKLVISSAVPLEALYIEGEMRSEFMRTQSRLQEMQSQDYLRRHPWRHEQDLLSLLVCD
ncbi:MAG: cell division protein ZapE [Tatlockia sp.]|jgi:cell division protein ZapE